MRGYCVKCRTTRDIKLAKSITMKNGKPATQGVCATCGTRMFKVGAAPSPDGLGTVPYDRPGSAYRPSTLVPARKKKTDRRKK